MEGKELEIRIAKPGLRDMLLQAARLLDKAIPTLDVRVAWCDKCGLKHYQNRAEFDAHRELTAVRGKIMKFVLHPEVWKEPPPQPIPAPVAVMEDHGDLPLA